MFMYIPDNIKALHIFQGWSEPLPGWCGRPRFSCPGDTLVWQLKLFTRKPAEIQPVQLRATAS